MQGPYLRKYGAAAVINFVLYETDGSALKTDAAHASGDTVIMKDEGAEANTTNGFADEGLGYSIALTAAEMEAARIVVYVVDQGTQAWLDTSIVIETYGHASAAHAFDLSAATQDVNVAQISGDSAAADNLESDYDGTGYAKTASTIGSCTSNTDMRGTDNAALASVCSEARLAELGSGNLPADVDILLARLSADRAGYLDELGAANIPADVDTLLGRLTAARAGYLDKLNVTGVLAHSDAADTYKADVMDLAAVKAVTDNIPDSGALTALLADIATLLTRLSADRAGYLDELGAANIPADVDTLLGRLTAARAGYLDKLNVTGVLAHSDAADTYKADTAALALEANVQGHAAAAIAAFDPPTRAEATADKAELAAAIAAVQADLDNPDQFKADVSGLSTFDPAAHQVDVGAVNGVSVTGPDDLMADVSALALEANAQGHAAAALTAFDPPTRAEATADKAELAAAIAALNNLAAADLLGAAVEGELTLQGVLVVLLAVLAGKSTGGGGSTIRYRNQADDADRVVATVDEDGNRASVTLDAS